MSVRRTQCDAVLALLEDGHWHSTIEFVELGILRVPSRVFELRRRGLVIDVKRVPRNRSTIYVYRLVSGELDAAGDDASQAHELGTAVALDEPADAQLELHAPPLDVAEPRPTEPVDDVELPSLEERRRIAAEVRAAFGISDRRVAS